MSRVPPTQIIGWQVPVLESVWFWGVCKTLVFGYLCPGHSVLCNGSAGLLLRSLKYVTTKGRPYQLLYIPYHGDLV